MINEVDKTGENVLKNCIIAILLLLPSTKTIDAHEKNKCHLVIYKQYIIRKHLNVITIVKSIKLKHWMFELFQFKIIFSTLFV